MEGEVKGKTFKMKGHTLPGINQRSDAKATNVAEQGLAGSSAFQQFGVATAGLSAAQSPNIYNIIFYVPVPLYRVPLMILVPNI